MRQRLKAQGQVSPAEQGSRGERHLNGIHVGIGSAYELFPYFIGEIHHLDGDMFRQSRMEQARLLCLIREQAKQRYLTEQEALI